MRFCFKSTQNTVCIFEVYPGGEQWASLRRRIFYEYFIRGHKTDINSTSAGKLSFSKFIAGMATLEGSLAHWDPVTGSIHSPTESRLCAHEIVSNENCLIIYRKPCTEADVTYFKAIFNSHAHTLRKYTPRFQPIVASVSSRHAGVIAMLDEKDIGNSNIINDLNNIRDFCIDAAISWRALPNIAEAESTGEPVEIVVKRSGIPNGAWNICEAVQLRI